MQNLAATFLLRLHLKLPPEIQSNRGKTYLLCFSIFGVGHLLTFDQNVTRLLLSCPSQKNASIFLLAFLCMCDVCTYWKRQVSRSQLSHRLLHLPAGAGGQSWHLGDGDDYDDQ